MKPASLTTFTEAIRTFGATPVMPIPLRAAAMVPATCVPWSLVVGYQPVAERSGRPASVQLTESATSMLATRSGWSGSMPLSRTPTRTLRLPSVMSWAWSALIICMSHCSPSRGSSVVAVVDSLQTLAGVAPNVVAERRPVRVPHHHADLRPGLDDDAASLGDRSLDLTGLPGVGNPRIKHVAHHGAVGG